MLAQTVSWGINPFWVVVWAYLTIGLFWVYIEAVRTKPSDVEDRTSDRLGINTMVLLLWPVITVFYIAEGTMKVTKAIKEARRNTAAVEEAKRLKEEIERLKDKLYEMEQ